MMKSVQKKIRKGLIKTGLSLLALTVVSAALNGQSAAAMLEKSRNLTRVESFESRAMLTITDKNGNNRVRSNSFASRNFDDGTEKRLIVFTNPPEVEGTAILVYDHPSSQDEMWIYLPALNKTRRVISSERGKSFMGSEFTNADISWPSNEEFTSTFLAERETSDFIFIESKAVDERIRREYGYAKRISSVRKLTFLIEKIEFFDDMGTNYKTITIPDYTEAGTTGKFMITRMEAVNHSNGRKSEMVISDIVAPCRKDASIFDPLRLGR